MSFADEYGIFQDFFKNYSRTSDRNSITNSLSSEVFEDPIPRGSSRILHPQTPRKNFFNSPIPQILNKLIISNEEFLFLTAASSRFPMGKNMFFIDVHVRVSQAQVLVSASLPVNRSDVLDGKEKEAHSNTCASINNPTVN